MVNGCEGRWAFTEVTLCAALIRSGLMWATAETNTSGSSRLWGHHGHRAVAFPPPTYRACGQRELDVALGARQEA